MSITNGSIVTCQQDDLVSDHVGGTEKKTSAILARAAGGTLIVDEVYLLTKKESQNDYGQEVVSTLMRQMRVSGTQPDKALSPVSMIFIGYSELMSSFFRMNRGLERRTGNKVSLPPMTQRQILDISISVLKTEMGLLTRGLDLSRLEKAVTVIDAKKLKDTNASMGRTITIHFYKLLQIELIKVPHLDRMAHARKLDEALFEKAIAVINSE